MFQKVINFLRKLGLPDHSIVDEVTRIQLSGRDGLRYMERDHVLTIGIERMYGNPNFIVDGRTISAWRPPHHGEELTLADRDRILQNVAIWLERGNITYRIDL